MKYLRFVISVLLICFCFCAYAQSDTTKLAVLHRRLLSYLNAMENRSIGQKQQEVDFMIGSCAEGEVRNHVALTIYDYYLNSKLMGDEAVAIHVTDEWFLPGRASMANDVDLMNARIYAEFNKRSLIGQRAPSLRMKTPQGAAKEVLGMVSDSLADGCSRYRVLFLYDSDCSKCRIESILLKTMFRQVDYPIDFIAVYTGDNAQKWVEFREQNLNFEFRQARLFHYWDPGIESDYQRKYGVLQTPRMFLIAKDGTILGRNLDTSALMKLLELYASEKKLNYGEERSREMFSIMIPDSDPQFNADSVKALANYIEESTLEVVRDTTNFRQLIGDMLYYLVSKKGETFAYGSAYVADAMVLSRPDVWNTPDDTLKVVSLARMVRDMHDKAPVGSSLPAIKVRAKMVSSSGENTRKWKLSRLKAGTTLIFHTAFCEDCRRETEAAAAFASIGNRRFLLVNVDEIVENDEPLSKTLFECFDLSSLPFLLEIGPGARVSKKYHTLVEKQN